MTPLHLRPHERQVLSRIPGSACSARELTRAQALLGLDEGETGEEVAQRRLVRRQTVYNWSLRFRQRSDQDVGFRLRDAPRTGRPPTAGGIIDPLLEEVIDIDPREYGYRHTAWTAALLRRSLREAHGLSVGLRSIGLALARLGIRWQRPRHVLGQRPDTGRQAKGVVQEIFRTSRFRPQARTLLGRLTARVCSVHLLGKVVPCLCPSCGTEKG